MTLPLGRCVFLSFCVIVCAFLICVTVTGPLSLCHCHCVSVSRSHCVRVSLPTTVCHCVILCVECRLLLLLSFLLMQDTEGGSCRGHPCKREGVCRGPECSGAGAAKVSHGSAGKVPGRRAAGERTACTVHPLVRTVPTNSIRRRSYCTVQAAQLVPYIHWSVLYLHFFVLHLHFFVLYLHWQLTCKGLSWICGRSTRGMSCRCVRSWFHTSTGLYCAY